MESKIFPNAPLSLWLQDDFDKLLLWIVENNFSDLSVGSGEPMYAQLGKDWIQITDRAVSASEGFMLIDGLSKSSGTSARVQGGDPDVNFVYEVKSHIGIRSRFRVSATAILDGYSVGINIIMRTIASIPPTMEDLGIEEDIINNFFPDNGLILLTGVMGTGKSTTLAAGMRKIIETGGRLLLTYEAPIEYTYSALPIKNGPFYQSEIPAHVPDFKAAVKNAMRRAANVAVVGEARDADELHAMVEMASRGVATYSTLHTKSAQDALSRILSSFPHNERFAEAAALFDSIRMIVQQRLLPRKDNPEKRVGVREYIIFTEADRRTLKQTPIENITQVVKDMIDLRGTGLLLAVRRLYKQGLISNDTLQTIELERAEEIPELTPS